MNVQGIQDQGADVKRLVQRFLSQESAGRWLLIVDNADDADMWNKKPGTSIDTPLLYNYLPRSKLGCILFTTRTRKIAVSLAHSDVVEVREMSKELASEMINKLLTKERLVDDQESTLRLLQRLTFLPLAIEQAAAYINENEASFEEYFMLLQDKEEEAISILSEDFKDERRYQEVNNPIATTWLVSSKQIQHQDPLVVEYLSLMACFDPKDVPISLLPAWQSRKKTIDATGALAAYSLITKRPAGHVRR
jgi:hypothetical protein